MNAERDRYALFAQHYDDEHDAYQDDLALYRQFAIEAGGPVLELGCGSGRVLAALASTGLPLTGVDRSPSMLRLARERLPGSVALVKADMRDLAGVELPHGPFWFAFAAVNTFHHLEDATAQRAALEGARRVVAPGGLLLLDLLAPDPHELAALDGRLAPEHSAILPDGGRVDKFASRTHDAATQIIQTTLYFDRTAGDGTLTRVADTFTLRYMHRYEAEHLLELSGWRLIALYGSYELEPYASGAERMLALATWGTIDAEGEG